MADRKKFRWRFPSCFGSRQPSSMLPKITSKVKRKYPAVADIMSSGYADVKALETASKMYIYYAEAEWAKNFTWHGDRDWNVVYFIVPTRDMIVLPLVARPVSPYWFWHATEAIRRKHPKLEILIAIDEELFFLFLVVFPYHEFRVKEFGDYKNLPPEEKVTMADLIVKYKLMRAHWF